VPDAETAYLFRHSMVRDAAYELQPLSERGRLHELALGVIDSLHEAPQPRPWNSSLSGHTSDPWAMELYSHAELAREASPESAGIAQRAAQFLKRAAWHEDTSYRTLEALRLYERLAVHPGADATLRVHGHIGAGQMYYRLGQVAKAGEHYRAAQGLVDEANDPQGATVVRTSIAIIDSHSDNGPGPAMVHKQAAEFWRGMGNLQGEISGLVNYGIWHCEFGDEAEGEKALQRAVELSRRTGNPRLQAAAIGNLATLWDKQKRLEEAEPAMREAIEFSRSGQNPFTEVTWTMGLGNLLRGSGRLAEAERAYQSALEIARGAGLEARVDYAQCHLAMLCIDTDKITDARRLWEQAWPRVVARRDEYTADTIRRAMIFALEAKTLSPEEWLK
jgi:tetratricopeptide (TPR) repeat protein